MNHDNDTRRARKVENVPDVQLVCQQNLQAQTNQWLLYHQTLCLCEVVQPSGVQDDADSRTHRIAAAVLRELQLRNFQ